MPFSPQVFFQEIFVKIDWVALAKALEDGSPDTRYMLDRQTGEILLLSAKTMGTTELLQFKEKIEKEPSRYVPLSKTPSEEKYRDLELFIQVIKDKKLQERLRLLLQGGNPVRSYLDAVNAHPQAKESWRQFKTARIKKRIENFLKENGLL